jgi:hypothetical protein
MIVAGRSIEEWQEFARRDDCLDRMVPSDLRQIVAQVNRLRACLTDCLATAEQNADGLSGPQVGLFIGRLRNDLRDLVDETQI